MPPLATVVIPVASQSGANGSTSRGKTSKKPAFRPRIYGNDPLPVKPSEKAPKNARIVGRTVDDHGVNYSLKIGDVELNDVTVEEILDYVSALDLEDYENREFVQERQVLKVLAAEREREEEEKKARRKWRAKQKGIVTYESATSTDTEGDGEATLGRYGRKIPDFTQFYPKGQARPKSEATEDELNTANPSEARVPVQRPIAQSADSFDEPTKRRRRKRDPATGELLPLSPGPEDMPPPSKRPRRRRHPETGELMPLGWRYDLDGSVDQEQTAPSPSFRQLSIADEPGAKRQKLGSGSRISRSSTPVLTKAELAASITPKHSGSVMQPASLKATSSKRDVVELLSSDDDDDDDGRAGQNVLQTFLKKSPGSGRVLNSMTSVRVASTATSSEPEAAPAVLASASKLKVSQRSASLVKTSIMNPSANPVSEPEEESDEEWVVDKVLGHNFSDPKSHPTQFGTKPVILYQVKWHGFDHPTWEPTDSFGDLEVVNNYRKRVGLPSETSDAQAAELASRIMAVPKPQHLPLKGTPTAKDLSSKPAVKVKDEAAEYDVERITAHHLSDPRTHPSGLGSRPVMLYQVKWKGFRELTWEPAASFADKAILNAYNKRFGLPAYASSGEDEDMDDG